MKNNTQNILRIFLRTIPLIFVLGLIIVVVIFYNNNERLKEQIMERDSLIENMRKRDSLSSINEKENAEIITKYISDCNILIDGKKLSTVELISYISDIQRENILLTISYDSLLLAGMEKETKVLLEKNSNYDSLKVFKRLYEMAQRDYGISYKVETKGNATYYSRIRTKVDTALLIYPLFKNRIVVDSLTQKMKVDISK